MSSWEEVALIWPAPLAGIAAAVLSWRAEARNPSIGRWRAAGTGLIAGTLIWPAALGMLTVVATLAFRLAIEALWTFLALVTWMPGRG